MGTIYVSAETEADGPDSATTAGLPEGQRPRFRYLMQFNFTGRASACTASSKVASTRRSSSSSAFEGW